MSCRFVATDQPRELANGDPCPEAHCIACGHRHVEQLTCATCIGDARTDLGDIVRLYGDLPAEAQVKGVESEAADLHGATADVGAWRQRRSYGYRDHTERDRYGNLVFPDRLGENAPLWVLGSWDQRVTEHYGHKRTKRITVKRAADYLAANLTELAQDEDFAFDDLWNDLRRCRMHLEDVLRDGDRDEVSEDVACLACGEPLRRRMTAKGMEDTWYCRGCHDHLTWAEYSLAAADAARREFGLLE